MRFYSRSTLLFSVFVFCAAVSPAQSGVAVPAGSANKVYMDVVVTPKSGGPVSGLQASDFSILDNTVARPITSFAPNNERDPSTGVIVVMDAVNADFRTVSFAREQVDKFLRNDGGELAYPTALALLTDKGLQMQQGASRDGKALSAALDQQTIALRTIKRSAGFYGAQERLDLSLQALDRLVAQEATKPGRKIVLWVSPGWPLLSGPGVELTSKQQEQLLRRIEGFSTELRKARVTLYSVDPLGSAEGLGRTNYYREFLKGVSKPSKVEAGDLALQVLATQSGGLVLNSNNDITGMLKEAVGDAKAYYELSFEAAPADHPGEYHQIVVQVAKPGLVARTRSGYYAQP